MKDITGYSVNRGSLIGNSQDSTLTITSSEISKLSDTISNFKCVLEAGAYEATSPKVTQTVQLTKIGTYSVNAVIAVSI